MDLLPPQAGKKGRRQNTTAKAWIVMDKATKIFTSKVSLGKGRIYERSTQTARRNLALDFNRAHLIELLNKPPSTKPPEEHQQSLFP